MQQVHGGAYDFLRFTGLGHRRLFRHFEEIASGPGGGPAIVLAWSWLYFVTGFARSRSQLRALEAFARLTGFWLQYLDGWVINTPRGRDGTWGYYFCGRRSEDLLSDRELIGLYDGAG